MTSMRERYDAGVGYVESLLFKIRKIEESIDEEAHAQYQARRHNSLPGATWKHIANGMKASDGRIKDLRDEIEREVARTTMYGLGALMEQNERLETKR